MPLHKDELSQLIAENPERSIRDLSRELADKGVYATFESARSALRRIKHAPDLQQPDFEIDKTIGDPDWRKGLALATEIIKGKRAASYNQSTASLEFPNRERVDFICLGDLHFFSSGTDHEEIVALTERILAEPNLYIVLLGDIIENAINLRGVAEVQSNLMPTGYQLAIYEDWLREIKDRVLFATHDNHASERFEKNAGCDFFGWITSRMVAFFDGIAHVDIKLGKQVYKLMATHKTRGRSMLNPTHGQQRYGRFDAQDREILLAADSHVPGISKYRDGDTTKLAVNVGTLNVKSAYARRYFSVYSSPVFPVVSLYRERHDASAFWTLDEWSSAFGNLRNNN